MPRLSLGLGVDGSGQIAPAAPSGIPVASTNIITAFASPMTSSVSYVYKISQSEFAGNEYSYGDYSNYISITFNSGTWTLYAASLFDGNVQGDATYTVSGVAGYIPLANAGWTPAGISFIEFVS